MWQGGHSSTVTIFPHSDADGPNRNMQEGSPQQIDEDPFRMAATPDLPGPSALNSAAGVAKELMWGALRP